MNQEEELRSRRGSEGSTGMWFPYQRYIVNSPPSVSSRIILSRVFVVIVKSELRPEM